jgi:hypothetical protein
LAAGPKSDLVRSNLNDFAEAWLSSDRRLEYFTEATIMLCMHHCFLLSDFVDDPVMRYNIGYSLIESVCINLLVNLLWLLYNTLSKVIHKFKQVL